MPAAASQAGTKAAIPRIGMARCSSTLKPAPVARRWRQKYPMQAALMMMLVAARTMTRPVPTMANATSGV
jgi:hypothetical protein